MVVFDTSVVSGKTAYIPYTSVTLQSWSMTILLLWILAEGMMLLIHADFRFSRMTILYWKLVCLRDSTAGALYA